MIYKVLYIVLLVSVAIQAAPTFDNKLQKVNAFMKKVGSAAEETMKEKHTSLKAHADSLVEVGKVLYAHGLQSFDTKKVLIAAPFKFSKKVLEIVINKDKKPVQGQSSTTTNPPELGEDGDIDENNNTYPPLIVDNIDESFRN